MQVGKRAKKIIKHTFKHTINVIEIVPRKCNKKLRLLLENSKLPATQSFKQSWIRIYPLISAKF